MQQTITWLARSADVKVSTIRFYEREGLLPVARADNGYRLYDDDVVDRVRFIRRAVELGFSINEVALALRASDRGVVDDDSLRALARAKVAQLEAQVADLQRVKAGLETLLRRRRPAVNKACPLINAVLDAPPAPTTTRARHQRRR